MIPKKIHLCWFSGDEITPFLKKCINTWKEVMPAYEIRLWDASSFDFDSVPFVKEAYANKKWAFVTDYIRLYALYTEGGIYLDSDVRVFKPFDEWLNRGFFSGIELVPNMFEENKHKLDEYGKPLNPEERFHGIGINAAIMAAKPKHPYMKDCLEAYNKMSFYKEDGSIDLNSIVIGSFITKQAEKYGFVYQDKKQELEEDMLILPSNILVGNTYFLDKNSYAIHLCNGSWHDNRTGVETFIHKMQNKYPNARKEWGILLKVYYRFIKK